MLIRINPRTPFGEWIVNSGRTVMDVTLEARKIQERFADKTVRAAIRGPVGRDAAAVLAHVSGIAEVALRTGRHVVDIDALDEASRADVVKFVEKLQNAATSCAPG